MAKTDRRKWLWANYGDDRDCLVARIRRYIEENNVPGWEVVSDRVDGERYSFKVMKFEKTIVFEGKEYNILFLEAWYYDEGEVDIIKRLISDIK